MMKNKLILFGKTFWKRFQENKLSVYAGHLTYSTMLAIVPLVMVIFSIFAAFPIFDEATADLKTFIYDNFAPNAGNMVQEYLDLFVSNSKKMGLISTLGLVVVAIMLIAKIDESLNEMWHKRKDRSLVLSFVLYTLILIFAPILTGLSIAISSYIFSLEIFSEDGMFSFSTRLLAFAPFVLTWLLFTMVYLIVPNTPVKFRHAACGAIFGAIFFTLGKQVFVWYITTFPSYQAIYGALAVIPIMILWINLSWLVVLLGGQFAAVLSEVSEHEQPQA